MTVILASTPGLQGPPGVGINPRGAWSATTTYAINDCVTYNGSAYTALTPSVGAEPDITPLQWNLLVAAGQLSPAAQASVAAAQAAANIVTASLSISGQKVGIVGVGDSISAIAYSGLTNWLRDLCYLSGQTYRYRYGADFAVSGSTAEQALATQMPQVLAMNPLPNACVIACGSNNYGSSATIASGFAAVTTMIEQLLAAGIQPILWTVPPRGNVSGSQAGINSWNALVYQMQAQYGFPLVDCNAAFQDPNNPAYLNAAYTFDGTHPTVLGSGALAAYVLADPKFTARARKDAPPWLVTTNSDANNLLTNGLFNSASNSTTVADGVTLANGVSGLLVKDSLAMGNWQRFTRPANAGAVGASSVAFGGVVAGSVIEVCCRLRASSPAVTWGTTDAITGPFTQMLGVAWQNANWSQTIGTAYLRQTNTGASEVGVICERLLVPAGAANVSVLIGASNAGGNTQAISVDIAQLSFRQISPPAV
ncbi:hypothetical protein BKK79_36070 [Cupriavidus sp. USMAA2-4]|uniref:GDSL-type esterase/lipase family protein n=1 Tax=Cupriavidus sp. USMAA2-4 TaxID=876364 RepID=UPI0008A6B0AF|nr:GDSL-type esterase/lipase family protein [Cupriavidus sp. USMAA2-4]AOY96835.1 hypothetical protein BKK79_35665 [Cupriavidus sp. USMAA2-4]AOY96910.1 hypothetical protein BKK79_36070 [Cupriavidus sp. USMAA2-4]